jgi:hypothetical protein
MRRALFLVLVVALLASPVAAAAHQVASTPTFEVTAPDLREVIAAAEAPDGPPWIALLFSAGAALAIARRPRRTIPVLLVLVAAVLAFETGVHSTHHLGQDSSSCPVASVASQVTATLGDTVVSGMPCGVPPATLGAPAVPRLVSGVLPPDAGRAPPAASA